MNIGDFVRKATSVFDKLWVQSCGREVRTVNGKSFRGFYVIPQIDATTGLAFRDGSGACPYTNVQTDYDTTVFQLGELPKIEERLILDDGRRWRVLRVHRGDNNVRGGQGRLYIKLVQEIEKKDSSEA